MANICNAPIPVANPKLAEGSMKCQLPPISIRPTSGQAWPRTR